MTANVMLETVAEAICDAWGYDWSTRPTDKDHYCTDFCDCVPDVAAMYEEKPDREQFRKAAAAAIKAMGLK